MFSCFTIVALYVYYLCHVVHVEISFFSLNLDICTIIDYDAIRAFQL